MSNIEIASHAGPNMEIDSSDAVIAAPNSHRILLENEKVRVLEIIIPPGQKEPMHTHRWPSVMMIDSSTRIRYYDESGKSSEYDEKATTGEPFVEWLGPEGLHAVENLDQTKTYHGIRIELKSDLHTRWPHRWLTPKAEAKDSPLHGLGVFAKEKILKGEPVNVFGGIAVPVWEIEEYRKVNGHIGVQVSDQFFMVPSSREELKEKGIFNHSCEPNVGFNTSVTMVAIRDIEPNEELLMSYAFMESAFFEPFTCNCGSLNCRKTIDNNIWKDPEFQEEYKNYYSPYLKDKIV